MLPYDTAPQCVPTQMLYSAAYFPTPVGMLLIGLYPHCGYCHTSDLIALSTPTVSTTGRLLQKERPSISALLSLQPKEPVYVGDLQFFPISLCFHDISMPAPGEHVRYHLRSGRDSESPSMPSAPLAPPPSPPPSPPRGMDIPHC
jgi:hypothetical protein